MVLALNETWIKAAVEHVVLKIQYFSGRTKQELTEREVEPDFVGQSSNNANNGYWTTYCHLRGEGPRCFKPDSIIKYEATTARFTPPSVGRWKELIPIYEKLGLKDKPFN